MSADTSVTYVFDAYGTLFDVHAAINSHRESVGREADRCSEIWRTKQLEYTWTLTAAGQYVDFWKLTERALDFALARCPSIDKTLKLKLLDAYFELDAYADARPLLQRLKRAGHRTAILSNGSPRMLAAAVDSADCRSLLDAVLSVDSLQIYKPRPEVYALVTDHFGIAHGDVTFVSSNRWDVMGATVFGFDTIWVNRAEAPDEYSEFAPRRVVASLSEIAETM